MANKSTLSLENATLALVKPWLETDRQFRDTRIKFHTGSGYLPAQKMYRQAIPLAWKNYQEFNERDTHERKDGRLIMRTGRLALEAAALARVAYVHARLASGMDLEDAHSSSFNGLEKYQKAVWSGAVTLPHADLLHVPLTDALREYTGHNAAESHIKHAYIGLVALSTRAIVDAQTARTPAELVLPTPGISVEASQITWNAGEQLMKAPRLY